MKQTEAEESQSKRCRLHVWIKIGGVEDREMEVELIEGWGWRNGEAAE